MIQCIKKKSFVGFCLYGTFLILLVFTVMGCGGKKPPMMTILINSSQDANRGQPVYMLVRTVSPTSFVTENYQSVAGMVMADPPNKSVLDTVLILPGKKRKLKIEKPDNRSLGVYCMFTNPEQWKLLINQPLKKRYKIQMDKNSILLGGKNR